jgi:hypothetical protein
MFKGRRIIKETTKTVPHGTEAQEQVHAAQLAVAQFNDAGGRMGVKSGRDAFSL